MSVTQVGGVYTLDGVDDLCGGADRAAVAGTAFPKPDGTLGLGFNIVLAAGAQPLHVSASISLSTVSGTWQDSGGNSGSLVFNPAISPGSPRPAPRAVFLSGLSAGNAIVTNVGTPLASGDAANKTYVDTTAQAAGRSHWITAYNTATVRAASASLTGTTISRPAGQPVGVYCVRFQANSGVSAEATVGSVQSGFNGGVLKHIVVTTFYGHNCNATGSWNVAVETFNSSGALADSSFQLLVAR